MINIIKRSIAGFSATALVLGTLAFAPSTFAAEQLLLNLDTEETHVKGSGDYEVSIKATGAPADFPFTADFYLNKKPSAPVTKIESHEFTQTGETYTFEWNGDNASLGDYNFVVKSDDATIGIQSFELVDEEEPIITFNPTPSNSYDLDDNEDYEVKVRLQNYVNNEETEVKLYVYKKGSSQGQAVDTDEFDANETLTLTWDGDDAEEGTYIAKVTAESDNYTLDPLTREFEIEGDNNEGDSDGEISFTTTPEDEFELDSDDDFEVSVELEDEDNVVVTATIDGPGNLELEGERTMDDGDTYVFKWDKDDLDKLGDYELTVQGEDTSDDLTNKLTHDFEVVEELSDDEGDSDGKISFTTTPKAEYELDSDDDYKVSVKLEDEDDVVVTAKIDGPGTLNLESKRTMDDGDTFVFVWDKDDLDKLGDYELTVQGEDKNDDLTNKLTRDFEVVEELSDDDEDDDDSCAGYDDVKENNVHCDALEWLKAEGIMTGKGNGDLFAGNDNTNRAETAKMSLMAFDDYDADEDYCDGDKPLNDVSLNQWYSNYICRAVETGMITGYKSGPDAGNFVPGRDVSVIEMFAIFLRPLDVTMPAGVSYTGLLSNQWYSGPAKFAKDNGYYPGTSLLPTKIATRYEIADFLYEMHLDGEI